MKATVLGVIVTLCCVTVSAQTPQQRIESIRPTVDRLEADLAAVKAMLGPVVVQVTTASPVQSMLDIVAAGSVVEMESGVYQGPFTVRQSITIRAQVSQTVRIVGNASAALIHESGDLVLDGIELTGNSSDLLWQKQTAGHLTVRNSYIHGDATLGAKRGIQANGHGLTLEDSVITDIFRAGQESSGIGAWDTPGPFVIRRNLIQAASINFLFGGADPSSEANIPSDITIEDNEFSKKLEWRTQNYSAKNLGELKNVKRVIIRNNLFRYSWVQGQTGYGLVLAVRNQNGGCVYCTIEDVLVEGNTIQDVGTAVSILGRDSNYVSQTMRRVSFRNNTFDGINKTQWGGRGVAFEILRGPESLTIEGTQVLNPVSLNSSLFFGYGAYPAVSLVVRGNRFVEGSYGMIGDGSIVPPSPTYGTNAIAAYAPGYIWELNTVVRSFIRTIPWPAGTVLE